MEEAANARRWNWKVLTALAAVLALAAVWATIALAGGGSSSPTGKGTPAKAGKMQIAPAAKQNVQKRGHNGHECPLDGGQTDNAAL